MPTDDEAIEVLYWQFLGGPPQLAAGRPKGARNKVSEGLLEALAKHFESNGAEAIEKVCADRPHDFIASLVPKQMEIEDKLPTRRAEDMTDDELAAIASGAQVESKPHNNGSHVADRSNGADKASSCAAWSSGMGKVPGL